jgi:tyrosinase
MKPLHLAAFLAAAQALPSNTLAARQSCTSPRLRKSWGQATEAEKLAYLEAAVCVTKKPGRLGNADATLHDDFALTHAQLSFPQQSKSPSIRNIQGVNYLTVPSVHGVAAFLPWHRYFVQVYEQALQECGYTGTAMYWDWAADSSAITQSTVWHPVTGFGGNGTGPPQGNGNTAPRVMDGPFKDYEPRYWSRDVQPHGLCRNWVVGIPGNPDQMDLNAHRYTPAAVQFVMDQTNFPNFTYELENGPHSAVHFGVGGGGPRMGPAGDLGWNDASPNDPIFFLHHTQVDRLWWLWQQEDSNRILAYEGLRNLPDGSQTEATLDDPLPMGSLAPASTVREYMDASSPNLCYTY